MTENHLRKKVNEYADIIEGIEKFEIAEEELISKLKAKIRLFDGKEQIRFHITNISRIKSKVHMNGI